MEFQDDAAEFSHEDVEQTVKTAIQSCLNEVMYNPKKVDDWTNAIVDSCVKELQSQNRPFKYVVTCIIMQKNGAGMNTSASMFWDSGKDGFRHVAWENSTIHCIVTVYGCAVHIDNPNELD
mmetsp:Transcript_5980/g.8209  ORF Transcript_5980/g.8209 Transcript_5980/m.8209 type:complete len:121 (+) Transcript_5980:74-436(+)